MSRSSTPQCWLFGICGVLLNICTALAQQPNVPPKELDVGFEYRVYQTEPNLRAPVIEIRNLTDNLDLIQAGHIFIDPFVDDKSIGLGPHIYDTYTGELIWSGLAYCNPGTYATQNTHVCDFLGSTGDHLCFTEAPGNMGLGRHRVFNKHYEAVGNTRGFIGTRELPANRHEFTMLPGGNAFLNIVYRNIESNLTAVGGDVEGHLREGCIQELDVATEEETFGWCGTDHGIKIEGSYQPPPPPSSPMYWDFMHLNSVDKNEEGDYLVSARYFDQVWKIAGPNARERHGIEPGTIIWRFGRSKDQTSNFTLEDEENTVFRHQHDARFIATGKEVTIITLFDNHNDLIPADRNVSSAGKMFAINNQTMTAKLVKRFPYPEDGRCRAMGSNRLQPNGNVLVGWGERAFYTEFGTAGEILLHASFKQNYTGLSYNYRVLKSKWVGEPKTKPKVIAYSLGCSDSPLLVYMSWNGATEVHTWRVSISSAANRPWVPLGMYPKTGFETEVDLSKDMISQFAGNTPRYVRIEAFDESLSPLGEAEAETFIPSPSLVESLECDEQGCHGPKHFLYEASQNSVQQCKPGSTATWWGVASLIAGAEAVLHLHQYLWTIIDDAPHFFL